MKVRNLGLASVCAFTVSVSLHLLRLFNVIGSEYDILVNFFSVITLILTTVFVGVLLSAQTHVRGSLILLGLLAVGFICTPLVVGLSATLVNTFPLAMEVKLVIAWVLAVGYLVGYMAFLYWLNKKRGFVKRWDVDSAETKM
nr:hypothetical protein [Candidatus Njordarchaeota archaeon]